MATLGMKKGIAAFVGILLLASGARAQNTFVLPWVETPPNTKPKATVVNPEPPVKPGPPALKKPAGPIQQVGGVAKRDAEDSEPSFLIQLTPPGPQRLFRFESEQNLRERIRQEWKHIKKVEFPPTREALAVSQQAPRIWPYLVATAEPCYVCYKRLWFEQKNSERYGWDLGVLQPFVSAGVFYTDLALLPLHWVTDPLRWYECSAGECLPGDPVPFLWNPVLK
jgi:hypothetical protein